MLIKNIVLCFFIVSSMAIVGQEEQPASAEPKREMFGIKDSKYIPIPPEKRGQNYKFPEQDVLHQRALWGWKITLANGQGFGFGGIATWSIQDRNGVLERTDDPMVRTRVLRDGKWFFIDEDLRKKNPLQSYHEKLLALRDDVKHVYGLARYLYSQGKNEADEKAFIDEKIAPFIKESTTKLKEIQSALSEVKSDSAYVTGQAKIALDKISKLLPALQGIGSRTTHENFVALRQARIGVELAAEAVDAEPPARVLSIPVYDEKSGLFVIFGGEHFNYLLNDIWVFDPKAQQWEQRHPTNLAPEPRANHLLLSDGQGKITVRGGYIYARRNPVPKGWDYHAYHYVHAGPGDWVYDLSSNSWSGPAEAESAPSGTRGYREIMNGQNYSPDYYTTGARPNAAEHEQVLKSIPVNTWVDLKPSTKFNGGRDWGTLGYDAKRDMIYFYNGGHVAYCGTDVAHYSLSTNRWDQLVETDLPLNLIGHNGESIPGWSFSRQAWMTNHLWNSYKFHPGLDKLLIAGRFTSPMFPQDMGQPDANLYMYNPDTATWERTPSIPVGVYGAQLLYVPGIGMLDWSNRILDEKTLEWKPLGAKGEMPKGGTDHCGLVHDPKRSRVLFFGGGGARYTYGDKNPYKGDTWAMSLPSFEVTPITIEGSEHIGALTKQAKQKHDVNLREVVYHPETDLFIINSYLPGSHLLAFDPSKNRWVGLEVANGKPTPEEMGQKTFGLSTAWAYDSKRNLIYSVGHYSHVCALRLDPKTLKIRTLAEIVEMASTKEDTPEKK